MQTTGLFSCTLPYCIYNSSTLQYLKHHRSAAGHHIDELEHMANRAQGAPQLDNAGSDLDTEAHTGLDQVPATVHQCIDDVELAVGHPPEDAMPRPWQMSQQRGELSSVFGCSFYTRSRVWHQARASTYGYWCK
jgi:hypothetical protein